MLLPQELVFCLVDLGGEMLRAALVGVQLLHQAMVRGLDLIVCGARFEAKDGERVTVERAN